MKREHWTCGDCGYAWPKSTGAVPSSPYCPSCGAEVAAVAAVIPKPTPEQDEETDA